MKILFEATATDEDSGRVLGRTSSYDVTGLEHALYKLEEAAREAQEEDEQS